MNVCVCVYVCVFIYIYIYIYICVWCVCECMCVYGRDKSAVRYVPGAFNQCSHSERVRLPVQHDSVGDAVRPQLAQGGDQSLATGRGGATAGTVRCFLKARGHVVDEDDRQVVVVGQSVEVLRCVTQMAIARGLIREVLPERKCDGVHNHELHLRVQPQKGVQVLHSGQQTRLVVRPDVHTVRRKEGREEGMSKSEST